MIAVNHAVDDRGRIRRAFAGDVDAAAILGRRLVPGDPAIGNRTALLDPDAAAQRGGLVAGDQAPVDPAARVVVDHDAAARPVGGHVSGDHAILHQRVGGLAEHHQPAPGRRHVSGHQAIANDGETADRDPAAIADSVSSAADGEALDQAVRAQDEQRPAQPLRIDDRRARLRASQRERLVAGNFHRAAPQEIGARRHENFVAAVGPIDGRPDVRGRRGPAGIGHRRRRVGHVHVARDRG